MKRTSRPILLTLLLAVSLTACGGNTEIPATIPTPTGQASTGPTAEPTLTLSTVPILAPTTEPTQALTAAPTTGSTGDPTAAPTTGTGGASTPTMGSGAPPEPVGSGESVIRVVVTGGPNAGTYDRSSPNTTCSAGLTGDGSWGNQYSDSSLDKGFSSLQMIVPNAKEAAAVTSDFLATFTFGKLFAADAKEYTIDGRGGSQTKGSGTVKIIGDQNSARVVIQAVPEAGVQINATIQCNKVFTAGPSEPTKAPVTAATINLTLEGGPSAGTYNLSSTSEVCGYGTNSGSVLSDGLDDNSDAWTVEYRSDNESDKLNAFELMVPKTKNASNGTNAFYLSINDQQYFYDNQNGAGTDKNGTVTVHNNGDTGSATVDLQTSDGKKVKATIDCKRVTH